MFSLLLAVWVSWGPPASPLPPLSGCMRLEGPPATPSWEVELGVVRLLTGGEWLALRFLGGTSLWLGSERACQAPRLTTERPSWPAALRAL